jgi:multicomponent Na+:H+ antiporter subunit E
MIKKVAVFLFWFAVWCALSYPLSGSDILIGVFTAAFVSYMTIDLSSYVGESRSGRKLGFVDYVKRTFWLLYYIPVFLWECIKANVDVAYRVLHPDLPIKPGTIAVNVSLKSDIGLTFLANSITLTPGTTSVDIDREKGILYVHWIYVKDGYGSGGKKLPVVEKFENILVKVFE